jgi:hypothetical protein
MAKTKRPTDPNQLGKFIVDQATGQTTEPSAAMRKEIAAIWALGAARKGGQPARLP